MKTVICTFQLSLLLIYLSVMCSCSEKDVLDAPTPLNAYLSAYYKKSFAYHTVANRMPVVVTRVVDTLTRAKDEVREYGEVSQDELKNVISAMSELKYEIQTNKIMRNITSDAADVKFYNDYLDSQTSEEMGPARYFYTIWLLSECYMYRRIREAFELTETLKDFDPFQKQKESAFTGSLELMRRVANSFVPLIDSAKTATKEEFVRLLKFNLWGNRCDLSFGTCAIEGDNGDSLDVSSLDSYILSDHSDKVWDAISTDNNQSNIVDFVLDNAAYELYTDLCIADYIVTTNLGQKVRFYVKKMPWFVSDTTIHDFHWLLSQVSNDSNENLQKLGQKWSKYIEDGIWSLEERSFWTLPVDYSQMKSDDPELYKELGESKLVIFKGDLNYRKLFGEKNWDPTTSVEVGLQGFNPNKLCTLRTLKADIACGISADVVESVNATNKDWMITGEYGVIQFCDKVLPLE